MTKAQVQRLTDVGFKLSENWAVNQHSYETLTITEVLNAIPMDLTIEKVNSAFGRVYGVRATFGPYGEYLGEANTLEEAAVLAYENYQKGKQDQQV